MGSSKRPEEKFITIDPNPIVYPGPASPELRVQGHYKATHTFAQRREEVDAIRNRFPRKIPLIIERFKGEKSLKCLDRQKFLVPAEITVSQFATVVRSRLSLKSNQAVYFTVAGKSIATMSITLVELYRDFKDKDGFLYITYASHECFG